MKNLILLLAFLAASCHSRDVSFTAIVKKENATKEGIYLNGYVVNISYDSIQRLNRKRITVSGNYEIMEGLKQNDTAKLVLAGRRDDWKYIGKPKIEIAE